MDRLGDSVSFTVDDLAVLQALAGHLTVALRNTELVARLRHEATHDMLTGLPNRALLTERLQQSLAGATDTSPPAVLLLDLNRFKEVNDALGHHVGDQLLQVVAAACKPSTSRTPPLAASAVMSSPSCYRPAACPTPSRWPSALHWRCEPRSTYPTEQ